MVVTRTSTVAAAWGGATAVIWLAEFTVKETAGIPPNVTLLTSLKLLPLILEQARGSLPFA